MLHIVVVVLLHSTLVHSIHNVDLLSGAWSYYLVGATGRVSPFTLHVSALQQKVYLHSSRGLHTFIPCLKAWITVQLCYVNSSSIVPTLGASMLACAAEWERTCCVVVVQLSGSTMALASACMRLHSRIVWMPSSMLLWRTVHHHDGTVTPL
jgi:hypothetical protein